MLDYLNEELYNAIEEWENDPQAQKEYFEWLDSLEEILPQEEF